MRIGRGGRRRWMETVGAAAACGVLLAGCAPEPPPGRTLESGYAAFNAGRYNEAYETSAGVLKANPSGGPNTSAALYLQGRVLEQRAQEAGSAGDSSMMAANLQSARDTYARALSQGPTGGLDASIRSQLANVAYFQDDYATALAQWTETFPKLDALGPATAEAKPWTLYRIGLCQQRLGRFGDADVTFAKVQKMFPGTEAANRAASHEGATAFGVQVGTFANDANAESVASTLRNEGFASTLTPDNAGRRIVRVGPLPTYEQARTIRNALAGRYPGAIIIP